MSEKHKVTETYLQRESKRLVTIHCSCGISVKDDPRKVKVSVLKKRLEELHTSMEETKPKEFEAEREPITTEELANEQREVNQVRKKRNKPKRKVSEEDESE